MAPLGKVPILEKSGVIVYDSLICNDYLDEIYPENKLRASDPFLKAREKMTVEIVGKVVQNICEIFIPCF